MSDLTIKTTNPYTQNELNTYTCHSKKEIIQTDAHESFISYDPIGTVLAIIPWNYPFWQVFKLQFQILFLETQHS